MKMAFLRNFTPFAYLVIYLVKWRKAALKCHFHFAVYKKMFKTELFGTKYTFFSKRSSLRLQIILSFGTLGFTYFKLASLANFFLTFHWIWLHTVRFGPTQFLHFFRGFLTGFHNEFSVIFCSPFLSQDQVLSTTDPLNIPKLQTPITTPWHHKLHSKLSLQQPLYYSSDSESSKAKIALGCPKGDRQDESLQKLSFHM